MSVLSLISEVCIVLTLQNKFAILLSPKQTLLLPVEIAPEGEVDLPAFRPKSKLLSPVVTSAQHLNQE